MRSSLAIMWSARAAVCAGLTAALLPAQSAPATPPASTGASAAGAAARLQRVLDSLDALPGARLHVLVRHLEAGWEAGVRSDAPAPMASVYKLPIALGVLALADDGRGALTDTIRVEPRDFAPFWSPLAREAGERAARLSIDSALVLMVGLSDNTIADVLLANPGRDAINEALRRRRVQGVVVGDSERGMALRATGIGAWPAAVPWSPRAFDSVAATVPTATRAAARAAFLADPDNTASPRALVTLLAQLHGGALLLQPHTRRLLEILRASPTGAGKLRAGLPPGTPLAHKTGSGGDGIVSNDVGLVTLPDGGTLAIAAMVADYTLPDSSVDARIAAVARAAWAAATQPAPGAAPDGAHAQATGGGSGLRCREYVRCVLSVGDELETRRGLLTRQRVRTGPFL
ncbi:MAG: class A beta-lactamase-related serine hydrolase, partial [Gemmatimonadaceae bacterium]|nr:class A beta-lactamase-related serine hydrolase [Gemmatimonadaceae bacterium]